MICADVHNHTIASHGLATVGEMFAAAQARNLAWYGFSEHSPLPPGYSCPLYKGDLAVTFPAYAAEVMALREQTASPAGVYAGGRQVVRWGHRACLWAWSWTGCP